MGRRLATPGPAEAEAWPAALSRIGSGPWLTMKRLSAAFAPPRANPVTSEPFTFEAPESGNNPFRTAIDR